MSQNWHVAFTWETYSYCLALIKKKIKTYQNMLSLMGLKMKETVGCKEKSRIQHKNKKDVI